MAKSKISSKDFLDLLDEQSNQPSPQFGSLERSHTTAPSTFSPATKSNGKEAIGKPIGKQDGHQLVSPLVSDKEAIGKLNGKQLVSSPASSNLPQKPHWEAIGKLIGKQDEHQLVSPLVSKNPTPSEQPLDRLTRLPSIEIKMLSCIVESCLSRGQLVSSPLSLEFLASAAGTTKKTIKTAGQRLIKKGLLLRSDGKRGNGGWTVFAISETTRNAFLEMSRIGAIGKQLVSTTQRLLVSNKEAEREATAPSSSSLRESENLKTTTTGEPELFDDSRVQLSPDWSAVDFSNLADVGFSRAHLLQLAKHGKLSSAEVQDSIHFFSFDLKRNAKGKEIKGPPVNFFMGILRKGLPYAPPENYESPEAEARRRYLEGKRRIEEEHQAQERELAALEFAEWSRGLSREEINAIVPEVVRFVPRAEEASLKAHFQENVWPLRRVSVPGAIEAERAEIRQQIEQSLQEGATS